MDPALLTVAAGLRAHLEALELTGNNIANASTAGYKRDDEFYRLFITAEAEAELDTGEAYWMPVVEGSRINFEQGPLTTTEGDLDVALSGPGFLTVEGTGGRLYTRNGSLTRSATGRLQTHNGFAVLDTQGQPIDLPPTGRVEINSNGVITAGGVRVAQLGVVEFEGSPPLSKVGRSYFEAPAGRDPQPAAETVVRQGRLEASNVNVPEAAVRLIQAARSFEMLRRAASLIGDEMNGRAIEVLGRTN